jgi:hypothetical protein
MHKKRRRKGILEPLGKLMHNVYPAPQQLHQARIFAWWNRAVPQRIVKQARPVHLSHGTLIVHVSSSVWAHELHYLSQELLTRLQAFAPEAGVKQLRFKVGKLPELRRAPRRPKPPKPEPIRLAALPEELGRALSRVHDDSLRDVITRAATSSLSRRHRNEDERAPAPTSKSK